MIQAQNVGFAYETDEGLRRVLHEVTLSIQSGEMIAVLGQNGCGKSTFARLCNALLPMQEGKLTVAGFDTSDKKMTYELRRVCGMVFQNPDNQFVSSVVQEEVAFGPENYEVPRQDIGAIVKAALHQVALDGFEHRAPYTLSGGQKQRLAIAGVLALSPKVIIFDEATAMLDPMCRREVLAMMKKLQAQGHTIVMITHYVEEAVLADRVALMQDGKILAFGTAREILCDKEKMDAAKLLMPHAARVYYDLLAEGITLPMCPLTEEELLEAICRFN